MSDMGKVKATIATHKTGLDALGSIHAKQEYIQKSIDLNEQQKYILRRYAQDGDVSVLNAVTS